jgi:hypothetical protein
MRELTGNGGSDTTVSTIATFSFYLTLSVLSTGASVGLLGKYASPVLDAKLLTLSCTFLGWLTSFSVLALVPIDVATTLTYDKMKAETFAIIGVLWDVSYWSTQALTWLIIPIVQHVAASGERTISGKVRHSFGKLWRFYAIVGGLTVLGILVAVAMGKLSLATLPTLVVLLSNTYGLIAILLLLGYGLVYVPKSLYRYSNQSKRLQHIYYKVGRSYLRFEASVRDLRHALDVMVFTQRQVPSSEVRVREAVDACVKYADLVSPIAVLEGGGEVMGGSIPAHQRRMQQAADVQLVERLSERDLDYAGDEEGIARLRERVQRSIAECVGSRGEYLLYVEEGIRVTYGTGRGRRDLVKRVGAVVLAVLSAAMSAVIVWCEATIVSGKHPDLSPLSLLIRDKDVQSSLWGLQLLTVMPLAYVAFCVFYSLFELSGLFSLKSYHMVARGTHSWSLLLNASLLSRFAAPLAFNYLHVIRMTGHQRGGQSMVFTSGIYGALTDVPLLGARFNTWFPLLLVVYVALLLTGVFERLNGLFGFAREKDAGEARIGESRLKVEWEAREQGGAMGADVLCGSTGEVELGSGALGKGFRYTYDSPVAAAHVAETGSSRVAGTDEQDETETLFSNIGRSR